MTYVTTDEVANRDTKSNCGRRRSGTSDSLECGKPGWLRSSRFLCRAYLIKNTPRDATHLFRNLSQNETYQRNVAGRGRRGKKTGPRFAQIFDKIEMRTSGPPGTETFNLLCASTSNQATRPGTSIRAYPPREAGCRFLAMQPGLLPPLAQRAWVRLKQ